MFKGELEAAQQSAQKRRKRETAATPSLPEPDSMTSGEIENTFVTLFMSLSLSTRLKIGHRLAGQQDGSQPLVAGAGAKGMLRQATSTALSSLKLNTQDRATTVACSFYRVS